MPAVELDHSFAAHARAIGPYDGRYHDIGEVFSPWFSEFGLQHARLTVEIKYLQALSEGGITRPITDAEKNQLASLSAGFNLEGFARVKAIEAVTRHDVVAVVDYLQEKLQETTLADVSPFVHWCLTSEDVTNNAYRIGLKEAKEQVIVPAADSLIAAIADMAEKYKAQPMLSLTHGQPAVATTFGKEMINFALRLHEESKRLEAHQFKGKMTGAVGNLNAHQAARPDINWLAFSEKFIKNLGLEPISHTTQVNPNDDIVHYLQSLQAFNGIVHGLDVDLWLYISRGILHQQKGGVGSSTMPQKINPIDFEHSEGTLEIANALAGVLVSRLPESRMQRDLSDTPLFRQLGPIHAQVLDAWRRTAKGLGKVSPNAEKMREELRENWAILSEPLQLILRQAGIGDAYEVIRQKVQGGRFTEYEWAELIDRIIFDCKITDSEVQSKLRDLTPDSYTGDAEELVEKGLPILQNKNGTTV
jgi:adenylosuccinate lyase